MRLQPGASIVRIPAFPVPVASAVVRRSGPFAAELRKYAGLYVSGRSALFWTLSSLGLPQGATVWVPSFHCGVEVQAVIDAGLRPAFFAIRKDATIDEDDLRRKLRDAPGPVLLIHYFGFPQPGTREIARLCDETGCLLIEDCAHSLFSCDRESPLGSAAAIAIFSLRKSLPILDGGAVGLHPERLKTTRYRLQQPYRGDLSARPYVDYAKAWVRGILGQRLTECYRRRRPAASGSTTSSDDATSHGARISWISDLLARVEDPVSIRATRRANYEQLARALERTPRFRPVYPALIEGVCPLFLPIWVENRDAIMREFACAGIETFRFGAQSHASLDVAAFPDARILRDNIVCLPIHQQLASCQIQSIAEAACYLPPRNQRAFA